MRNNFLKSSVRECYYFTYNNLCDFLHFFISFCDSDTWAHNWQNLNEWLNEWWKQILWSLQQLTLLGHPRMTWRVRDLLTRYDMWIQYPDEQQPWNIEDDFVSLSEQPLPKPNINPKLSSVNCCSARGGVGEGRGSRGEAPILTLIRDILCAEVLLF